MKVVSQTLLSAFDYSIEQEFCLSMPGKTFLAGEYLALSGGRTLVMSTNPKFKMTLRSACQSSQMESKNPFHQESPAGKLWLIHQELLKKYVIEFQDPYALGGFGASSAQFALLWASLQILKTNVFCSIESADHRDLNQEDGILSQLNSASILDLNLNQFFRDRFDVYRVGIVEQLLNDYRQLAMYQGRSPSGADIIGPFVGGLCMVQREPALLFEKTIWPFSDKAVLLFHTKKKMPTHDHISQIQEIPDKLLAEQMAKVLQGLQMKDWDCFIAGLSGYRQEVQNKGWLAQHSAEILSYLDTHPKVKFAKGCGAMGSDVVAVFCAKNVKAELIDEIQEKGLILMASEENITDGISICR